MRRRWRERTRLGATVAMVIGAGIVLAGCGGQPMSDDELYEQARERNAAFKASVAAVQQQLDTGEWRVTKYGGTTMNCGGGYKFEMRRLTVPGFRLASDAVTTAEELSDWLKANGWSDVTIRTYSGEISDVLVQARNEHVERLDVDIQPGEATDGVIIRADSVCYPGDVSALAPILMPDWPRGDYTYPELEAPDETPYFGFTEDGEPRR